MQLNTPMTFMGIPIYINDVLMSKTIEDWSKVRSPSRAKRRMKYGHKQNVVYRIVPREEVLVIDNKYFMHTQIYLKFKKQIEYKGINK